MRPWKTHLVSGTAKVNNRQSIYKSQMLGIYYAVTRLALNNHLSPCAIIPCVPYHYRRPLILL
jgi:hypothetical protein